MRHFNSGHDDGLVLTHVPFPPGNHTPRGSQRIAGSALEQLRSPRVEESAVVERTDKLPPLALPAIGATHSSPTARRIFGVGEEANGTPSPRRLFATNLAGTRVREMGSTDYSPTAPFATLSPRMPSTPRRQSSQSPAVKGYDLNPELNVARDLEKLQMENPTAAATLKGVLVPGAGLEGDEVKQLHSRMVLADVMQAREAQIEIKRQMDEDARAADDEIAGQVAASVPSAMEDMGARRAAERSQAVAITREWEQQIEDKKRRREVEKERDLVLRQENEARDAAAQREIAAEALRTKQKDWDSYAATLLNDRMHQENERIAEREATWAEAKRLRDAAEQTERESARARQEHQRTEQRTARQEMVARQQQPVTPREPVGVQSPRARQHARRVAEEQPGGAFTLTEHQLPMIQLDEVNRHNQQVMLERAAWRRDAALYKQAERARVQDDLLAYASEEHARRAARLARERALADDQRRQMAEKWEREPTRRSRVEQLRADSRPMELPAFQVDAEARALLEGRGNGWYNRVLQHQQSPRDLMPARRRVIDRRPPQ